MGNEMSLYTHILMNKGNHKKQVREFARSLGLEKKFGKKIFSDENSKIEYKLDLGINDSRDGTEFFAYTLMDIYATNKENAIKIYDNLENLFDKINIKLGKKDDEEVFGRFIEGNPYFSKE